MNKNQRITRLSTNVDLKKKTVFDLNKAAKKINNEADNIKLIKFVY